MSTTISTTLAAEVTPGAGAYAANILVTSAGLINAPIAIYAATPATLLNRGTILGLVGFQASATLTNHGAISGPGVTLQNGGDIQNTGEILAGISLNNASLNNSGTITGTLTATGDSAITNTGATRAITLTGAANLTNQGGITGGVASQSAVYNQSGAITAPTTAILLNAYGAVTNHALISGGDSGVVLTAGGTVINASTIAGGTDAIFGTGYIYLTAATGAAFRGNVIDTSGHGQLNLTGAGSLNIANFTGFDIINLAPSWTLEGGINQLATGQSIRGFAPGTTLVLDYFAATGDTLTPAGLILSNGATTETLALENFSPNDSLTATTANFATTLTALIATIAAPIYTEVNPGAGNYAANLTIAPAGAINVPSGYATESGPVTLTNFGQITGTVRFNAAQASLNNQGTIAGAAGAVMSGGYLANAGSILATSFIGPFAGNGVYLSSAATLANTGSIHGPNRGVNAIASRIDNSGAISGGIGVELTRATLGNSGSVSGYVGLFAYAGPINTVTNAGVILGVNDGAEFFVPFTLANAGTIYGGGTGISVSNRYSFPDGGHSLTNTGSIGGKNIGVELSYTIPSQVLDSAPTYGQNFLTNAGTISGGTDAIDNLTGTLTLTADPGAVFQGAVLDIPGNADLILAGATAGTLNIASFSGFTTLDFAAASTWSLAATTAQLAGATITGFSLGDSIILDGFSATQNTFIPGTGLILGNGTATATLSLNALPQGVNFSITSGGGTTITAQQPMISTIGSYFFGLVTPGSGDFTADLLITNTGIVVAGHTYPTAADVLGPGVTLTNAGEIIGGASLGAGAVILNQGTIYDVATGSGQFGINSGSGGTIINTGAITGNKAAINLTAGGTLFNAGAIGAVLDTGALSLILDTGGSFSGPVTDISGTGQLTLAGSGNLLLDGAASFSGFSAITFAPGAAWSLEGNIADLASGQTIVGLIPGGALILDGFAANTYAVNGDSLILSNPTATATLNLGAIPRNRIFSLSPDGAGTRITPENAIVSIITTTITNEVTPRINNYTSSLTITAAGEVNTGTLSTAVYSDQFSVSLNNQGQIIASGSQFNGVEFTYRDVNDFDTVLNSGTIYGGSIAVACDQITNSGTLLGGSEGAYIKAGTLTNTGLIWGGATGVQTGATYYNLGSTLTNAGGIGGGSVGVELSNNGASVLTNAGSIWGGGIGVNISDKDAKSLLLNSGSIGGGIGISFNSAGAITNSGTISGVTYAVLASSSLQLYVNPGAVFNGAITDTSGNGVLVLQGSTPGTLDLGHDFSGFSSISFAPGAIWTLEDDNFAVTPGRPINGFTGADTIILDGITATPQNFVTGPAGAPGYIYLVYKYFGVIGAPNYVAEDHPGAAGSYALTIKAGSREVNNGIVFGGAGGAGAAAGKVPIPNSEIPYLYDRNGGSGGIGGGGAHVTGGILINNGYIGGGPGGLGGAPFSKSRYYLGGANGLDGNGLNLLFGTVINHGWIGGLTGAIIANGILADYGTIVGLASAYADAVSFSAGAGTLLVGGGGVLIGDAAANANDALILAGTSGTAASIGTQFQNFGTISLARGAAWTLEVAASALAAVQTISGFGAGDTLVLDGFAANSETFGPAGLILSNASTTTTLALNAPLANNHPLFATYGGNTTLSESAGPPIVINTAIGNELIPISGQSITITPTGTIGTDGPAIFIPGSVSSVYILNNGTLTTPNTALPAIYDNGAGVIVNNNGGINAQQGVYLSHGGTLFNAGNISGPASNFGVRMTNSYLNNAGAISAATDGVIAFETSAVTNTGAISGGEFGIILNASILDNAGTISSPLTAVNAQNGAAVVNAGTISGARYAIDAAVAFALTAEPGAVFNGAVSDSANAGILILGGNGLGSLDLAPSFTGFSTLAFAAGSYWTLEGTATQLASGETVSGFTQADAIILDGFSASTYSYTAGAGLTLSNAQNTETLGITGSFSTSSFIITDNPDGNTVIELACFVRGTRIATPRGNIAVEKLSVGDLVKTMHGDQPIRWIGRRAYAARFIAGNPDALPIRIRRHAIAPNIPSRDLYVSPDHAIAEGGVLIHAHLLQNGISIHQPERNTDVEYFHLEFDTHTILFAENISTESFIDEGAGNRFQNSHTRIPTLKPQKPCLPRVFEGFHLHNIKSRIAARAGISPPTQLGALIGTIDECTPTLIRGWAQNSAAPEHPVTLEIISGGFSRTILANSYRPDLRAAKLGSGCHGFSLPLPNLQHPVSVRRLPDGATLHGVGRISAA